MTLALGLTLVVSLGAPSVLRPLLVRMGIIDVPNARSSHRQSVIRGAGLATLIAVITGHILLLLAPDFQTYFVTLLTIAAVSAASGVLGWLEDSRGLSITIRAMAQVAIGLVGAIVLATVQPTAWWFVPLFAVCLAGYINVANFMDGINGISGLHGVVVGSTYALIGVLWGESWMVPAGLVLALSFLGFLPWNLLGRGMFLGDTGSYLLGGGVAVIAAAAVAHGVPLLAVAGPLAIYLADSGVTLVRRLARGERWYEAHRTHVYQRLTDLRLSHVQVALIVSISSVATGAAGLVVVIALHLWLLSLALLVGLVAMYLSLEPLLSRIRTNIATDSTVGSAR